VSASFTTALKPTGEHYEAAMRLAEELDKLVGYGKVRELAQWLASAEERGARRGAK